MSLLPEVFLSSMLKSPGLWQLIKSFCSLLNLQTVVPTKKLAHQADVLHPYS